jgi:hypothetical protein
MTDQRRVRFFQRVGRVDVAIRHNENMRRRGGMDIAEGGHLFVAKNNVRFGGAIHDLAEDAIAHVVVHPKKGLSHPPKGQGQGLGQASAHRRCHSTPTPQP